MNFDDVILRIVLAMIIGGVIGWERESSHRPAGLRTHILVSLGAAMVMMTGVYNFDLYRGISNVDPSRMAAQVISGIGFLGAGTIMREGANIRGLTTAASLWVVACLGIAVGAGFYLGAIGGTIVIFITLSKLDFLEKKVSGGKRTRALVSIKCIDGSRILKVITEIIPGYSLNMSDIMLSEMEQGTYEISFKLHGESSRSHISFTPIVTRISAIPGVTYIKVDEY